MLRAAAFLSFVSSLALAQVPDAHGSCVEGCDSPSSSSSSYDYTPTPTYVDPEEEARKEREAAERERARREREAAALQEAQSVRDALSRLSSEGAAQRFRAQRLNEYEAQLERREGEVSGLSELLVPVTAVPLAKSERLSLDRYIEQLNAEEQQRQKELAAKLKTAAPPPPPPPVKTPTLVSADAFEQKPTVSADALTALLPTRDELREAVRAELRSAALDRLPAGAQYVRGQLERYGQLKEGLSGLVNRMAGRIDASSGEAIHVLGSPYGKLTTDPSAAEKASEEDAHATTNELLESPFEQSANDGLRWFMKR